MENKLASLQKDYEAAINDRAAAHAIIKEYEEVRKPFDDDHFKKKCDGQKNKKIGKLSKQKQKSRRKSGESPRGIYSPNGTGLFPQKNFAHATIET